MYKIHISGTYSAAEQSVQLELGFEDKDEDYSSLDYSSEPSFGHSQLDFMTPDSSRDEETQGVDGERD